MYLSRLTLNPRSRAVQRDVARPHELHRTVLSAFPDNLDATMDRVLYRFDQSRNGEWILLVQSPDTPDWSRLPSTDYLLTIGNENPAVKAIHLQANVRQQFTFRLRGNPTKRIGKSASYDKGKRVGLYKMEEQINWLQRKADNHGFAIQSAMPIQQQRIEGAIPVKENRSTRPTEEKLDARKPATQKQHDAKFFSVQFDGILQVTDPDLFLTAIQFGIGSGKAFGFGLLSVAPIRE